MNNFLVFFDFDKSTLTPRAMDIVKEAADVAKSGQNARLTCTGHTDTVGPGELQHGAVAASRQRGQGCAGAHGVPAAAITVIGRGETELLVQTTDGVREPQNRRVEIVIQ